MTPSRSKLSLSALLFALAAAALAPLASAQTPAQASHAQKGAADSMPVKPPVPPSKSINVTFGGKVITLTVEDLMDMPQVTVQVHNAHRNTDESYTGPLLSNILAKAGLVSSRETEPLILHSSVIATGTDGYFVLYSAAEVEPSFSIGKVIVAVMKAGLPDTEGGVIQLINTDDAKPARWVHGLSNVNVMSLSPAK